MTPFLSLLTLRSLALVPAEVEHLEGAEGFAGGLQLALDLDEPLARGVDAELAEVGGDPFAAEFFGHGGGRATAAEKVRHQIAFVAAGFENSFQKLFRLLGWIINALFCCRGEQHIIPFLNIIR